MKPSKWGMRETLLPHDVGLMKRKLYWLAFKKGDDYWLSPYRAESRQDALRHGMEHVLDRELVAVFSDEMNLTVPQMLELAEILPPPGSPLMRPPE